MFDFGKPEDTATLFRESALRMKGPALPDCSLNEMEEQDLRNMLTTCIQPSGTPLKRVLRELPT